MPELMDEVIEKVVASPTKFAILKLYKENPYIMDNRHGLSLWVGRPEEQIAPEIEEMVEMGAIHRWGTEPGAIYAYTRNEDMRRQLNERWDEITRRAGESKRRGTPPNRDDAEGGV